MNLTDARSKLAALLAPVDNGDPAVLDSLVDAITPPALMLNWNDPWLDSDGTVGRCEYVGHLAVTAVAGRLMPGDGIAKLEELVEYVTARVETEKATWVIEQVTGPRVFLMARTNYLACRIIVRIVVR